MRLSDRWFAVLMLAAIGVAFVWVCRWR